MKMIGKFQDNPDAVLTQSEYTNVEIIIFLNVFIETLLQFYN